MEHSAFNAQAQSTTAASRRPWSSTSSSGRGAAPRASAWPRSRRWPPSTTRSSFAVTGLSKDDRVVRVTVGVDLGPRTAVAKFSPQAQAAYAFVSAIFTSLYDHMPVYTAEPSGAERAAAAVLLEQACRRRHRRRRPRGPADVAAGLAGARPRGCPARASASRPDGLPRDFRASFPEVLLPRSPRSTGVR